MGNRRIGKHSQAEIAQMAGVSLATIKNWKAEGLDINDIEAVKKRAATMTRRNQENEDMGAVKLRKLKAEADLKEHELEVERGRYVSQESQRADGQKLGLVLQGMLLKMSGDLTPILAGRPAGEVKKAIDKYAREKLVELSQYAPDTLP